MSPAKPWSLVAVAGLLGALLSVAGLAQATDEPLRGSPGAGDPYFPHDGNGGYDVASYAIDVRYRPDTDRLSGTTRIRARATQDLGELSLDLVGLRVRAVEVDGRPADWRRRGQELWVSPRRVLDVGSRFTVKVRYDGVPRSLEDAGFVATEDGATVAGQPHVAASWFPVNDHPSDKASYTFDVTVPQGLEAVANGRLVATKRKAGLTTWSWAAPAPMASYLATIDIGHFRTDRYRADGVRYHDAIDPDLFEPLAAPTSGKRFAVSQQADASYQRLTRRVAVPDGGGTLGFTVTRATEQDWDFFVVEARTPGRQDWTTLRDRNGHTSRETGRSCADWPRMHPFVAHYQTVGKKGCSPQGSTGRWHAATGSSDGAEDWAVDLGAWAGGEVEISLTVLNDVTVQGAGVFVDDIVTPTGAGSTDFEDGRAGWRASGPPKGSPGNTGDWIVGTRADVLDPPGVFASRAFDRQPQILGFLGRTFGPYPFRDAGGILDATPLGFALETQTRPVYEPAFFTDQASAESVVVHELAHQWFGDSVALHRWRDIWLNEGPATYAEWLWAEKRGWRTTEDMAALVYDAFPAGDDFWKLRIGDPGPEHLFDDPVYYRGALTLHQLRVRIGDRDFRRLLRTWTDQRADGHGTTRDFRRLAERISGEQLGGLFRTWLFTARKPARLAGVADGADRDAERRGVRSAVPLHRSFHG